MAGGARMTHQFDLFAEGQRVFAPCMHETHCGSRASVISEREGLEAVTQETCCDQCGRRGVISTRKDQAGRA